MSCIERNGYRMGRGIVVLLLLLFVCLPNPSLAQTYNDFQYFGDESGVTIYGYTGPGGAVTIPSSIPGVGSVTSIDYGAFQGCSAMTSVTIPSSVTNIGGAFVRCSGLTNVIIPSSVISIGNWAFQGCSALTSVTIPSTVTSIGNWAFSYCANLTDITVDAQNTQYSSVDGVLFDKNIKTLIQYPGGKKDNYDIPNGVTCISESAFLGCNNLTSITIPSSVTSIGDYAFSGCYGLLEIMVDAQNTQYSSMGGVLFDKNLTFLLVCPIGKQGDYSIPESVTGIGNDAFALCGGLANVTIPSSVTGIGDYAFCFCYGLTNVTIPSSITNIGDHVFRGCFNLKEILVDAQNAQYSSVDGVLFDKNLKTLIQFPSGRESNNYNIPNGVTSIGDYAFESCGDLTGVTIPNSVTSIGDRAFESCDNLISIIIPCSVTNISEYAFGFCNALTSITISNSIINIGTGAFSSCENLTSITFFNSVTSIGDWAFSRCTGLTNLTIPSSVTSIGAGAFESCSNLISVTIATSVTYIGNRAFYNCSSLTSAYFQGDMPTLFGWNVFDSTDLDFSVYYPTTASGWANLTWNWGYSGQPYTIIDPPQVNIAPATRLDYANLITGTNYQLQMWCSGTWTNLGLPFVATESSFRHCVDDQADGASYRLAQAPLPRTATATAQLNYGSPFPYPIKAITVTDGGSGYLTPPAVTILDDVGSGAQATATISNGTVTSINIINPGSYGCTPRIQIDPPPVTTLDPIATDVFRLDSIGVPSRTYQIQTSSNLSDWGNFGDPFLATTVTNTQYLDRETGSRFFRLKSSP